eukprot:5358879-Prymnesium_polylepis.1
MEPNMARPQRAAGAASSLVFFAPTDTRGTVGQTFEYASWTERLLGLEPLLLYQRHYRQNPGVIAKLKARFRSVTSLERALLAPYLPERIGPPAWRSG